MVTDVKPFWDITKLQGAIVEQGTHLCEWKSLNMSCVAKKQVIFLVILVAMSSRIPSRWSLPS